LFNKVEKEINFIENNIENKDNLEIMDKLIKNFAHITHEQDLAIETFDHVKSKMNPSEIEIDGFSTVITEMNA
jgi:hypothetical protein